MKSPRTADPYGAHFRGRLLDVLALLASPEAQLDYQRRVPIAQVSAELFCQWADDAFSPEDARLQALFSPSEWDALLAFNTCIESLAARVPEPLPGIAEFVQHPLGRELASAARDALLFFPNEPQSGLTVTPANICWRRGSFELGIHSPAVGAEFASCPGAITVEHKLQLAAEDRPLTPQEHALITWLLEHGGPEALSSPRLARHSSPIPLIPPIQ